MDTGTKFCRHAVDNIAITLTAVVSFKTLLYFLMCVVYMSSIVTVQKKKLISTL
jgi:hypothetical protein